MKHKQKTVGLVERVRHPSVVAEKFSRGALIPAGLAFVLLLMGGIFGFVGRYEAKKDAALQAWPSTEATITRCGISTFRRPNDSREQQSEVTSYAYNVNGKTYSFSREEYIGIGNLADERNLHHKANDKVPIFYNPDDPQDASLTRERGAGSTPFFILFIGLAVLSLPFWYLAWRWAWPRNASA